MKGGGGGAGEESVLGGQRRTEPREQQRVQWLEGGDEGSAFIPCAALALSTPASHWNALGACCYLP